MESTPSAVEQVKTLKARVAELEAKLDGYRALDIAGMDEYNRLYVGVASVTLMGHQENPHPKPVPEWVRLLERLLRGDGIVTTQEEANE